MTTLVHRRVWGPLVAFGVCAAVVLLAQVPYLRNRVFYVWDDSAVQFMPTWHHLGQRLVDGDWPPLLDVDGWMGGNLPAEALFGIWNPVNLGNYVLVSRFDDLGLAALVVKSEILALLALGVYLVCREHGAGRGPAAVVAIALPFSGFTLYFDTSSWVAGLMAFAWLPYTWWAARRAARGASSPLWAILFGALAVTTGNPYGLLGVCVVLGALLVENWLRRDRSALVKLFVIGGLVAMFVPLVYLPLLGTSSVTMRAGQGFASDGILMPRLSDLLSMSMPSHRPMIRTFSLDYRLHTPGVYFAWFVVPLLPWLHWRRLRERWRELAGVFVVLAAYVLLAVGPSNMWMFRFPLRHLEVVYLAIGVLFAVAFTGGPRFDHVRRRVALTAAALLLSGYLSFAAQPWQWRQHAVALALLTVGVAVAVALARYVRPQATYAALVAGVGAALFLQTSWFPVNLDVAGYGFPKKVSELKAQALPHDGTTFPVGTVLPGNVGLVADLKSTGSYSGMSFREFATATCMNYKGTTCAAGFGQILAPTSVDGRPLVDLLRVGTILVQNDVLPDVQPPPGWRIGDRTATHTSLRREQPLPWPGGRLSYASPGVRVSEDVSPDDRDESVRFTKDRAPGRLVFARLAWPGYRAELGGRELTTRQGPAGLLVVDLPADVEGGELKIRWTPPGLGLGAASALAGLLGALVYALISRRRPRRERPAPAAEAPQDLAVANA